MSWSPDLRRILRRPLLPLLLVLQAGLAVGVMANSLSLISNQLQRVLSSTGLAEDDLWWLEVRREDGAVIDTSGAQRIAAALMSEPEILAVTRVNDLPLRNAGWRTAVWSGPDTFTDPGTHVGIFLVDEAAFPVLGITLISGRMLTAEDMAPVESLGTLPKVTLVSSALAEHLFGTLDVVGRRIYTKLVGAVEIVGVVETLQVSWPDWQDRELAVLMPAHLQMPAAYFAIKVRSGESLSGIRIADRIPDVSLAKLRRYDEIRHEAYAQSVYLIVMMGVFTVAVMVVVGSAAYALTNYWVLRRVHELGVRRAMGATKGHLFRLVFSEISLYLAVGCVLGGVVSVLFGWAGGEHFALIEFASPGIFLASALFICLVGQMAVWTTVRRTVAISVARAVKVV